MTEEKTKRGNAIYVRRHPRGKGKTSARAIRLKERQTEAYNRRRDGQSYPEMSKVMRLPVSTLQRYVQHHLDSLGPCRETLEVDRQRQLDRLDILYAKAFARIDEDPVYHDKCRRVVELQSRLQQLMPTQSGGGFNVQINNGGGDAETLGIRVIAPDWKPPINDPPPSNGWQDPPQLKALPPPRPNYGDAPEPAPPRQENDVTPPANNVTRLRTGGPKQYGADQRDHSERARAEGWGCDKHPNPVMSAFGTPRRKNGWMG